MKPNSWKMLCVSNTDSTREFDEEVSTLVSKFDTQGIEEVTESAMSVKSVAWKIYFLPNDYNDSILHHIKGEIASLNLPLVVSDVVDVERENWHDNWRQYFKPIELTPKLSIVPEWLKGSSASDKLEVAIMPGMAFGTGTHATTQLCMMAMEKLIINPNPSATLLDCGCGSAILSIFGAKLGIKQSIAFDIDQDSFENANENIVLNDIPVDRINVLICGLDDIDATPYDFIICNMLSKEFKPLLPDFPRYAKSGTQLVISGLLTTELGEISELVTSIGFDIHSFTELDEWSCIVAQKS